MGSVLPTFPFPAPSSVPDEGVDGYRSMHRQPEGQRKEIDGWNPKRTKREGEEY
jgi:hypothetical protein